MSITRRTGATTTLLVEIETRLGPKVPPTTLQQALYVLYQLAARESVVAGGAMATRQGRLLQHLPAVAGILCGGVDPLALQLALGVISRLAESDENKVLL
jgi:hypothetical protein